MARGLRSNKGKALRRLRREKLEEIERATAKQRAAVKAEDASLADDEQQAPAQQQSAPGTAGADAAIPAVESTKPEAQMPGQSNTEAMEIEDGCKGKQDGLGVSRKSMKARKQGGALNAPLHGKRKKGKKQPRAWFHGE